jgi:hypothetical protein
VITGTVPRDFGHVWIIARAHIVAPYGWGWLHPPVDLVQSPLSCSFYSHREANRGLPELADWNQPRDHEHGYFLNTLSTVRQHIGIVLIMQTYHPLTFIFSPGSSSFLPTFVNLSVYHTQLVQEVIVQGVQVFKKQSVVLYTCT